MNHADIKKHLADYLEGELPIGDRALLDAHLDACDSCAGEVEEMLQTIHLIRTLSEPEHPPMIAANVMRRIRSGESRLGFFGRIGRALGAALEPGFVLPASAIAAAALVVSVVQGFGEGPISWVGSDALLDENRASIGRTSSVTSQSPAIAATRRDQRARVYGASDDRSGMEFVARVERRRRMPFTITRLGNSTRIRISLEDFAGRGSMLQPLTPRVSPRLLMAEGGTSGGGPILSERIPDLWTIPFDDRMSRNGFGAASPGTLVVAERSGGRDDFVAGSGVWSQVSVVGESQTASNRSNGMIGEIDLRDAWLALGFEDPAEFARYIAGRNLAEQELWTARLSDRALERGFLGEFLQALRESGDPTAAWVADDFSARAGLDNHGSSGGVGENSQ